MDAQEPSRQPPNKTQESEPVTSELPTVEELEQANDSMSAILKLLIAALVIKYLAGPNESRFALDANVATQAARAARRMSRLLDSLFSFNTNVHYGMFYEEQFARDVTRIADHWVREHLSNVEMERNTRVSDHSEWTEAAANSLATRVMSNEVTAIANKIVDRENQFLRKANAPSKLKKVWVTRGDTRVRHTHKRLHGVAKQISTPFQVWRTGERIMHPGDSDAPFSEVVNCRCFLWLTYGSVSEVRDMFPLLSSNLSVASTDHLTGGAWQLLVEQTSCDNDNR